MAVELKVTFQIHVPLHVSDGKEVSELWPDAGDARLDGAEEGCGSTIRRNLFIDIADGTDEYLLGQKLSGRHIHVKVDPVLIIGSRIDQVVGKASDGRKFVARLRVEVGVAAAA